MPERKESLPKDKVNLRLLLVSGKSHDFLFDPTTTGTEIAAYVFSNWPSEWEEEDVVLKPPRHEVLRFLYRGKFLRNSTTLSSLSLPTGKTSVMHMVIRERLPDEQSQDTQTSQTKSTTRTTSRCCTIL